MSSVLFLITCHGSTPHYSMMRWLEGREVPYDFVILPAVKNDGWLMRVQYRFKVLGVEKAYKICFFSPKVAQYFFQYFFHFLFVSIRLRNRRYPLIVGEGNFCGWLCSWLVRRGKAREGLFLNGDVVSLDTDKPVYIKGGSFAKYMNKASVAAMLWLRRRAVEGCKVWYPTPAPQHFDEFLGFVPIHCIVAPGPFQPDILTDVRTKKYPQFTIGYLGAINDESGLAQVIDAIALIRRDDNVDVRLEVIGGAPEGILAMRDRSKTLQISELIHFHGFVNDPNEVYRILARCSVAVAMYNPVVVNISIGDFDNGKVKEYLNARIPIIATKDSLFIERQSEGFAIGEFVECCPRAIARALARWKLMPEQEYFCYEKDIEAFVGIHDYRKVIPDVLTALELDTTIFGGE